jgi:SAM-dependent methyltransferase
VGQRSQYDEMAPVYDEHFTRPVDRWEDDRLAGLLRPHVDGRSVLDLGCGTGWLLDHLTPGMYVGVDESQAMLRELRRKHAHARVIHRRVCGGDLGWIPDPWRGRVEYDAITSTWALQYLGQLPELLPALAKLIRPGGSLALHGYLPRYRNREHEISASGWGVPVVEPAELIAASDDAGLPRPRCDGTGALPESLEWSHALWRLALAALPAEQHWAALWTWRL